MPAADLLADTTLARDPEEPSRWRGTLPPAWSYVLPSGGVLMSVALRAMREQLAEPQLHLVSATSIFCDPIPEGPVVVDVTVLRKGSTAAQLRAHLRSDREGAPHGLEVSATFRRDRPGPDAEPLRMRQVPAPVIVDAPAKRRWAFLDNFDLAPGIGDFTKREPGVVYDAHYATWHRYRVAPRTPSGELDPIAIPPVADTMPGALFRHLGPEAGRFFAPSLDLTVYFAGPTRGEWLLVETRASRARVGWAIGHAFVWDEQGHLVAQANQAMFVRRPPAGR
jgi:acyl-coenzyme A thioesterase PaaI-like protein